MLAAWVDDGGNLIAMRPDPDLAGLVGLTDTGTDLAEGYLADRHERRARRVRAWSARRSSSTAPRTATTSSRAPTSLATLYVRRVRPPRPTRPSPSAVSARTAARWRPSPTTSRDRSCTRARATRPGPARSATASSRRSSRADDLFFPDWIDLDKVQIPQADEQQRLLANLIEHIEPRRDAAARASGTSHGRAGRRRDDRRRPRGSDGTAGQFDWANVGQPARLRRRRLGVRARHFLHVPEHPTQRRRPPRLRGPGLRGGPPRQRRAAPTGPRPASRTSSTTSWPASRSDVPERRRARNQPHPLHHLERLGDPAEGRSSTDGIRLDTNYYYWPAAWVEQPTRATSRAPACRCASPTSTAR